MAGGYSSYPGGGGFANPMTTLGDLIYGGASGVATRLAIGSEGQVLTVVSGIPGWTTVSGTGTVTSAGVQTDSTTSAIFANSTNNLTGSPITTSGNITLTLSTQVKNKVLAGPTTGSDAAPAFRLLVGADLPLPAAATLGGVFSKAVVSHQFLTSISSVDGSVGQAQPAFTDISGSVAASQLPNPSSSTLGGIQSAAAVTHQWINSISTSGVPALSQPAFSDISGSLAGSQLPTFTGDVTNSSAAMTVAKIQTTTVSGTTGTGNVVFSASPTFTGTVAMASASLSSATASKVLLTDGSKNLISSTITSAALELLAPSEFDSGNSGTTKTIDWTNGTAQKSTLTGNVTYTLSNPVTGTAYVLKIATGAGSFTVTWPAAVHWSGGTAPTITATASKVDLINLYWDGTTYFGSYSQNYAP